jgi:hypothetical protein
MIQFRDLKLEVHYSAQVDGMTRSTLHLAIVAIGGTSSPRDSRPIDEYDLTTALLLSSRAAGQNTCKRPRPISDRFYLH